MTQIQIRQQFSVPVSRQDVEIVERKGLGHPDTICDAIMEAMSVALSAEYLKQVGRVLHHNLDKGLLVAGQTTPALGGGRIDAPMRLVIGDRATCDWQGQRIPVSEIVTTTASEWIRKHLRYVDPSRHLIFQNELRPGSVELVDNFARQELTANDTSVGVGYAPLSETERLVLAAERFLNSADFKARHPETGEDIKVMGLRQSRRLHLTVAVAFIDRWISCADEYFANKTLVVQELSAYLKSHMRELQELEIQLNTLDDPSRGLGGMYLTVLGTSAEGADGGEVGRGNRVNGLISFHRPMTLEAAAGKNPVSHVGKIYNILSGQIAQRIHEQVPGIDEVYVWLCSRIGAPLSQPWVASVEVHLAQANHLSDVEHPIKEIVEQELTGISQFVSRLCRGEYAVC